MDRKQAKRFTSPAIGIVAVAVMIAIAIRPNLALPLLAGAEFIAGSGCALRVRTSLRLRPPAPSSAALFAALSCFWIGMAALSVWWYLRGH